jgi:MscS family membrane protein
MLGCAVLLGSGLMVLGPATAAEVQRYPLDPPDTSSPRAILKSFIETMDKAYLKQLELGPRDEAAVDLHGRAARCLDLSNVAPRISLSVGIESALLLKEVLDRIKVPPYEEIPNAEEVNTLGQSRWRLPHTEIFVAKARGGARRDDFLFTPETIDRVADFYT